MGEQRYEVVEKDRLRCDEIIGSLVEQPTQGVAYMCLRSQGPMSAEGIIESLSLSDTWLTSRYNDAVRQLAHKGLIKEVAVDDGL